MSGRPLARVDDFLRTPRGQLTLIAAGYALALAAALVMAANRPFFESKLEEAVKAPPERVAALARDLDAGRAGAAEVLALPAGERALLYDAWLTASDLEGDGLPRALAAAAPAEARGRVERTLVAGSPAQRARAIALARRSGSPELRAALAWARDLARARRDDDRARALDAALDEADTGGGGPAGPPAPGVTGDVHGGGHE
ncbi:MAG: hypothetical protein M9894_14375 [Planctomycetes bacterium]|nr:hypothetical protein [Planctomycetota bacterium]